MMISLIHIGIQLSVELNILLDLGALHPLVAAVVIASLIVGW